MRRKTFDALLTAGGLVLAIVLLVSGGLLWWANLRRVSPDAELGGQGPPDTP